MSLAQILSLSLGQVPMQTNMRTYFFAEARGHAYESALLGFRF